MHVPCWDVMLVVVSVALWIPNSAHGWLPVDSGHLQHDVNDPALLIATPSRPQSNTASSSPFTFSDFGLPVVVVSETRPSNISGDELSAQRVQTFYPLEPTLSSLSSETNESLITVSGADSVVALPTGFVLAFTMCSNSVSNALNDTILRYDAAQGLFVPVWEGSIVARNATCMVVDIATEAGSPDVYVAIVGGVRPPASDEPVTPAAVVLSVSLYHVSSNTMHTAADIVVISDSLMKSSSTSTSTSSGSPSDEGSVRFCILKPAVTQTSDGTIIVAGGLTAAYNRSTLSAWLSVAPSLMVTGLKISTGANMTFSVEVSHLKPLPSLVSPHNVTSEPFSSRVAIFDDSIYFATLQRGSPGVIASLTLSALLSMEAGRNNDASQEWTVETLPGPLFSRKGANLLFVPLQREGCVLGLFAVGGLVPESVGRGVEVEPSVSYMVFTTSYIPSLLQVPYKPNNGVTVNIDDENTTHVNVSVSYELVAAGATGVLALADSASCARFLSPMLPYEGSIAVSFEWTLPVNDNADAQSYSFMSLYLCFSDNESIVWEGEASPDSESVVAASNNLLFSPVNPLEPQQLPAIAAPSTVTPQPPSSQPSPQPSRNTWDDVVRFLKADWYYVVIAALVAMTLIAIIVSCRMVRRKGLRRALSGLFDEKRPLLVSGTTSGGDYTSTSHRHDDALRGGALKLSTTSHSSRYVTLSQLPTIDGGFSDVTYLVQRRRDGAMLVMKYIPCEGDVERLLSMHEFEALNVLSGHPNVVPYVDMFMNYAFSHTRLRGVGDSSRHIISDALLPTDSSIQTNGNIAVSITADSGLESGSFPAVASPGSLLHATYATSGSVPNAPMPHRESVLSPKLPSPRTPSPHSLTASGGEFLLEPSGGAATAMGRPPLASTAAPRTPQNPEAMRRYVCLVMEFQPLGNVAQWLLKRAESQLPITRRLRGRIAASELPPASEALILSIAMQMNSLLKYMHHDGPLPIVHKGLKPENVLVAAPCNEQGTFVPVVTTDFGFSILGSFTPPSRLHTRRRDSANLDADGASDCASRSSLSQPMDPSAYLQSSKCDMWCLGCMMLSLCIFRFGRDFPFMAELVATCPDKIYDDVRATLSQRGYSSALAGLICLLLHRDEALRPSAETVSRLFCRRADGSLYLAS